MAEQEFKYRQSGSRISVLNCPSVKADAVEMGKREWTISLLSLLQQITTNFVADTSQVHYLLILQGRSQKSLLLSYNQGVGRPMFLLEFYKEFVFLHIPASGVCLTSSLGLHPHITQSELPLLLFSPSLPFLTL